MMEHGIKLSVGELLSAIGRLGRDHIAVLLLYIGALTALGTALDLVSPATTSVTNIASFIAGYFLYEHLLRKEGLISVGYTGRSLGAYLGVGFLTGLASVVGLILLVVPGLILMARWSIASGLVVAEGKPVSAAMKESWQATRASQWSIVLLFVVVGLAIMVPAVLAGFAIGMFGMVATEETLGSALVGNLFAQIMGAVNFAIGVALMQRLHRGTGELESVFA